jgi:hypothetical protein
MSEVAVGRIPSYGTMADLDSILQKIIDYETDSGDISWRDKVLIPAAVSNFEDDTSNIPYWAWDGALTPSYDTYPQTFGDDWGNAVGALGTAAGCATYTLYEQSGCKLIPGVDIAPSAANAALTNANVLAEWQNHYGFVTWWGHGSSTGAYRKIWANDACAVPPVTPGDNLCQVAPPALSCEDSFLAFMQSGDCSSLNNSYPSFVFQVSCTNGEPETATNLGYSLLKAGALATVSASRVSWYAIGSWSTGYYLSCGDNASYAYHGFNRMTQATPDDVGNALTWCKSTFDPAGNWGFASWMNCLDFNLYGDPAGSQLTFGSASTHTLTVSATHGSVTKDPNQSIFDHNATVTLTALPDANYHFSNWTGDYPAGQQTVSPIIVTMDGNKSLTAVFAIDTRTLTVNATHGTVTKNPDLSSYDHGAVVTLTPHASFGYAFSSWSGDVPSGHETDNPVDITMDANKTVTAGFVVEEEPLKAEDWQIHD